MALRPHQQLILLCCRSELDAAARQAMGSILESFFDWQALAGDADWLEVLPQVRQALREVAPERLAEAGGRSLSSLYHRNLGRNLILGHELRQLITRLEESGIPAVPLKGILLAETAYGHPGLRQMCDLDVLVRPGDVAQSLPLLASAGFRRADTVSVDEALTTRRDLTLIKDTDWGSFHLELHWKFKDRFFRLPEEAVWNHLRDYEWQGQPVRVFSPELTLLHLVHHLNYHAYPLKILVDVAACVKTWNQEIEWDRVTDWAKEWGLARNLRFALQGLRSILGQPVPPQVLKRLEEVAPGRGWLFSLISHPQWHFSPRAAVVRADGYLRALFSALFLDGTGGAVVQALLRRREPHAAGTGTRRRKAAAARGWLRNLFGLAAGVVRFMVPYR